MKRKTYWDKAEIGFYEPIKIKGKIKWDVELSGNSLLRKAGRRADYFHASQDNEDAGNRRRQRADW